ncbi:hypothetical protein FQN49_002521 [Arthroderma sp. PD_2]|nr:hypothetical protein FQN49_002521 [Arthroderma sp. PD_2]
MRPPSPPSHSSSLGNLSTDAQYGSSPSLLQAWLDGITSPINSDTLDQAGSPPIANAQDDYSQSHNFAPLTEVTAESTQAAFPEYTMAEGMSFGSDSPDPVASPRKRRRCDDGSTRRKSSSTVRRAAGKSPSSDDASQPDGESEHYPDEEDEIEQREKEATGKDERQAEDVEETLKETN